MYTSNEELKAMKKAINLVFDARKKFGGPITEAEAKMVDDVYHRLKDDEKEMTFRQLQEEHQEWITYNFGDQPAYRPFLGMVEELGELAHALLKKEVGIRGTPADHDAKAKDAIADIIIYTAGFCGRSGWDLQAIVEEVWPQVRSRDWKKWPISGHPERTCPDCQGNGHLSPQELGFGPGDEPTEDEVRCNVCNGKGWIPKR